ncbi:hypothetical protein GYH30_045153 [Glycine max]|uniref:Uncharacterized protein n=1 Tax=Glycine max TaxID=3847 RepID=A0A0R0FQW5_SOYBN|nr:hypothetical protein GYH30_045153 [Glycine max]
MQIVQWTMWFNLLYCYRLSLTKLKKRGIETNLCLSLTPYLLPSFFFTFAPIIHCIIFHSHQNHRVFFSFLFSS